MGLIALPSKTLELLQIVGRTRSSICVCRAFLAAGRSADTAALRLHDTFATRPRVSHHHGGIRPAFFQHCVAI
jgi:hypothetical protein